MLVWPFYDLSVYQMCFKCVIEKLNPWPVNNIGCVNLIIAVSKLSIKTANNCKYSNKIIRYVCPCSVKMSVFRIIKTFSNQRVKYFSNLDYLTSNFGAV